MVNGNRVRDVVCMRSTLLLLAASFVLLGSAIVDAAPAATAGDTRIVGDLGFALCFASPADALQFINGTCVGGWLSAP